MVISPLLQGRLQNVHEGNEHHCEVGRYRQ